jgi:hypothetical protein
VYICQAVVDSSGSAKASQASLSGHHDLAVSIRSAAAATSRRSKLHWCKPLRFRAPPGPVTALVSFPGSGNTWIRYLVQQATGIHTNFDQLIFRAYRIVGKLALNYF